MTTKTKRPSVLWKIDKFFQGGKDTYIIRLPRGTRMTQDILEWIGENTNGGFNYGFYVSSRRLSGKPKRGARKLVIPRYLIADAKRKSAKVAGRILPMEPA